MHCVNTLPLPPPQHRAVSLSSSLQVHDQCPSRVEPPIRPARVEPLSTHAPTHHTASGSVGGRGGEKRVDSTLQLDTSPPPHWQGGGGGRAHPPHIRPIGLTAAYMRRGPCAPRVNVHRRWRLSFPAHCTVNGPVRSPRPVLYVAVAVWLWVSRVLRVVAPQQSVAKSCWRVFFNLFYIVEKTE